MKTLQGIVTDYHTDISVSGENASTTHYAHFMLNGQKVLIAHHAPVMLQVGDTVNVTGEHKQGIFQGYAWHNHTLGHTAHRGYKAEMVIGLIALAVVVGIDVYGTVLVTGYDHITQHQMLFEILPLVFIGGFFLLIGLLITPSVHRTRRAIRMLNASLTSSRSDTDGRDRA